MYWHELSPRAATLYNEKPQVGSLALEYGRYFYYPSSNPVGDFRSGSGYNWVSRYARGKAPTAREAREAVERELMKENICGGNPYFPETVHYY